jgi:hypothetical protein
MKDVDLQAKLRAWSSAIQGSRADKRRAVECDETGVTLTAMPATGEDTVRLPGCPAADDWWQSIALPPFEMQ